MTLTAWRSEMERYVKSVNHMDSIRIADVERGEKKTSEMATDEGIT